MEDSEPAEEHETNSFHIQKVLLFQDGLSAEQSPQKEREDVLNFEIDDKQLSTAYDFAKLKVRREAS